MKRILILRKDSVSLLVLFLWCSVGSHTYAAEGKTAFISNRDGEEAIYIMDGDGGNPYKLTKGSYPAWHPDGQTVGFVYERDLRVSNLDGSYRKNLTKGRIDKFYSPAAWSPDGKQIAYWGRRDGLMGIYTMHAHRREPQPQPIVVGFLFHENTLSWSRDGKRIAAAPAKVDKKPFGSDIIVINANGANAVNLTDNPRAKNTNPSWSPGGKRIAYVASPDPLRWWPPHNILVMNSDGTNPVILTKEDRWVYERHPSWSPDSEKIAFSKQAPDGFHDIFTINADGSDLRNITQTHRVDEFFPAWSPSPLAVSTPGRLVTQWGEVKQSNPALAR
ncbi:MAG: hypothetical protein OXT74_14375 [Candidatus Poribacteria bacterium]|nr:hypothetical protein [Candidatus Poribacteria bacterium]